MIDNINFWSNQNYYKLQKLTEDDVKNVERKLGLLIKVK